MFAELHLSTLLLITTRIAAIVLVAPGLGARIVPWRARLLLVALLAVPAFCVSPVTEPIEPTLLPQLMLHEAVVGLSLGMVPAVMIWGLQVALQPLQGLTGLPGVTSGGSPGDDLMQSAPLERFFCITVLALFFLAGGHRQLIQAMFESFRWLPPGHYVPLDSASELIIDLLAQGFALGVRALSPIIVALLFSMIAFAAVNRILPQLGYFAVGMNVQVLVLLGSVVLFLGVMGWLVDGEFATATERAQLAWKRVTQGIP